MNLTLVRVAACKGPDGCGRNRAVLWQSDCGCWVFKCLICGDVDECRCGDADTKATDENFLAWIGMTHLALKSLTDEYVDDRR